MGGGVPLAVVWVVVRGIASQNVPLVAEHAAVVRYRCGPVPLPSLSQKPDSRRQQCGGIPGHHFCYGIVIYKYLSSTHQGDYIKRSNPPFVASCVEFSPSQCARSDNCNLQYGHITPRGSLLIHPSAWHVASSIILSYVSSPTNERNVDAIRAQNSCTDTRYLRAFSCRRSAYVLE